MSQDWLAGESKMRSRLLRREPVQAAILSPANCRSQRLSLNWTERDLAARCGFPFETVIKFEAGDRVLGVSAQVALQRALRRGARA